MGNAQPSGAQIHAEGRKRLKLEILRCVKEFPITVREAIDEAKEEEPESFLSIIEEVLIDFLYGHEGKGLDFDRDTEKEIEAAIRFFPHVLCEKYWGTHPPIYAQLAYFKSVSFIPLLAKLGIELNQFQEDERGGLLYREWNVLLSLVNNDCREWYDEDDERQQSMVDEKYVAVMRGLRRHNLFMKEDILEQGLLRELSRRKIFPERRLRYLVDWDPKCLKHYTENGCVHANLPSIYNAWSRPKDIRVFRLIFELGMVHFPTEMAFLFHRDSSSHISSDNDNDNNSCTPFHLACNEYGTEKATKVVEDVLVLGNQRQNQLDDVDTLIYAATNLAVHLDGVYFLLRREPGRYRHVGR